MSMFCPQESSDSSDEEQVSEYEAKRQENIQRNSLAWAEINKVYASVHTCLYYKLIKTPPQGNITRNEQGELDGVFRGSTAFALMDTFTSN